jgi:hypothetical protein
LAHYKEFDKQTGVTYLGSLTIPFRDFSFVIKVQCWEEGITGLREALLFDEMRRNDMLRFEDGMFCPNRGVGLLMTSSLMTGYRNIRFRASGESCAI